MLSQLTNSINVSYKYSVYWCFFNINFFNSNTIYFMLLLLPIQMFFSHFSRVALHREDQKLANSVVTSSPTASNSVMLQNSALLYTMDINFNKKCHCDVVTMAMWCNNACNSDIVTIQILQWCCNKACYINFVTMLRIYDNFNFATSNWRILDVPSSKVLIVFLWV